MHNSPAVLPAVIHPSAFTSQSRQEPRQRSTVQSGHHHFNIIPCTLTRCLAAVPCIPLLQGRVLQQQCRHALINTVTGSPDTSAHHILHYCVLGHWAPHITCPCWPCHHVLWHKGGLTHRVPCPSSQIPSWSSSISTGWHTPCQTTLQTAIETTEGLKKGRVSKRPLVRLQTPVPTSRCEAKQVPAGCRNQVPLGDVGHWDPPQRAH